MPREELFLQDIIEAADAIDGFLKNIAKDDFLESDLIQSAVLQKLSVIGEASARISDDLRKNHPEIPWRQIVGFRNIAVHAYFSINKEVLQNEFPDFELRSETK